MSQILSHYFATSHVVCFKLTKYLKIVEKPGKRPSFATVQYELSDIVKYRTGYVILLKTRDWSMACECIITAHIPASRYKQ